MKPLRQHPALDEMHVYALVDPCTHRVFYVGRAINVEERLMKHCRDSRADSKVPVKKFIKRMLLSGNRPQVVVLEKTTFSGVDATERFWIRHFQRHEPLLKNVLLKETE